MYLGQRYSELWLLTWWNGGGLSEFHMADKRILAMEPGHCKLSKRAEAYCTPTSPVKLSVFPTNVA